MLISTYIFIHHSLPDQIFFPSRSNPCVSRLHERRRKKILSGRSISPLRFVKYFCLPALCYTVQFARVPVIWRTGGISLPLPFFLFYFFKPFRYISKWILDGWKIDMDIELPNFAPPSTISLLILLIIYLFIYLFCFFLFDTCWNNFFLRDFPSNPFSPRYNIFVLNASLISLIFFFSLWWLFVRNSFSLIRVASLSEVNANQKCEVNSV